MIVEFINKDLEELYEKGYSRKYKKVPKRVAEDFFPTTVLTLMNARNIQQIWSLRSLHFEKLTNTDRYSVRLDIRWRLEMKIDWTDKDCTVGIIGLTDLTKHYGD